MKVLHLSSERTWRGGEQQIAYLIEESIKQGVECFVACRKGSAFEEHCEKKGIPFFALGFRNELDFKTASRIKKICKEQQIDIVHMHSSHSHAMAVWSNLLGNNVKFVLSRRVDFPMKDNFLSRFKFNHSCISRIVCVSHKIEEVMRKDLKNPNVCVTVHSGIDIKRFEHSENKGILHKEYNLPENCRIVANISAIAPHKDYYTFVDTVAELAKELENVHYFVIGEGGERENIENYIQEKGLEKVITLTGFRNDIPMLMQEIDVFLMTSETEGLGTTILDAFANHVPVVSTNAGGIPESVKHEKTGLLANVRDSDALAKEVKRVLESIELQKELTQNAYEWLLEGFVKEKTAEKTIRIYKEILV
ncbi:MAG: glycosyltransferase family 4 protein [Cytophagales bacterium]|nr:glycosyltransferase family 4 protein [Cytophagales bacterium]